MFRKGVQPISAAQQWRQRMASARKDLPPEIGQQDVIIWIVGQCPDLDRLSYATRWRNAWLGRVADPEITQLVEQAAKHFKSKSQETSKRISRQKLKKVQ